MHQQVNRIPYNQKKLMEYLVGGVIINDNVTNSANISTGCLAVIMSFDPDCAYPVANFNL